MRVILLITCLLFLKLCSFAQVPVGPSGRFFDYHGTKIYYVDTGTGKPLILLHHFSSTSDSWKSYIPIFAKEYRVIAIDMVGHGRSDILRKGDIRFKHEEFARIVLDLMDKLKFDSVDAIGASSGGMTLLYANFLQPHRFNCVVTIGAQTYFSQYARNKIIADGPDSASVGTMNYLLKAHGKEKGELLAKQFWQFRNAFGDPQFTPDMLATITANWLVIQGDDDPFVPVDMSVEMHKYIPHSHLWIIPHGGHLPQLNPSNAEDFQRRCLTFLRGDWRK